MNQTLRWITSLSLAWLLLAGLSYGGLKLRQFLRRWFPCTLLGHEMVVDSFCAIDGKREHWDGRTYKCLFCGKKDQWPPT